MENIRRDPWDLVLQKIWQVHFHPLPKQCTQLLKVIGTVFIPATKGAGHRRKEPVVLTIPSSGANQEELTI